MRTRGLLLLFSLALPAAAGAEDGLLAVRDQNPLIRGVYLPLPVGDAAPGAFAFTAGIEWANTVNIESTPRESLLVDEESIELDLSLAHAEGPWRFRATLPVINRGPGILDSAIADWHRFFGLPQGDRPSRPRNAYAIEYATAAGVAIDVPRGTALGDLALEGGRVLFEDGDRHVTLWAGLEAPTGDRARNTGNGSLDAALWLEAGSPLGTRFALDGRAGVSRPGNDAHLPLAHGVAFGTLALTWHALSSLDAIVQFDAHGSAVRDSTLEFLGRAVAMTVGARYRLASGSTLEAGVVEDIEVDHSPDVTFHVGWHWPIGAAAR
jgi:hypothetical protein